MPGDDRTHAAKSTIMIRTCGRLYLARAHVSRPMSNPHPLVSNNPTHPHRMGAWILSAALCFVCAAPLAQESEPTFDEVISAIVSVEANVPSIARTASSLGTERGGTGVVIDTRGLVLTIGYLILEASSAQITFADGHTVPAQIVAYDHNTGFGLLRATPPAGIRPMELGDSSDLKQMDKVLVSSYGGMEAVQPAMVVSRRTFAGYWEYLLDNAIFTSPPHPEFGGAALIGPTGELLGIGSLVVSDAHQEQRLPGNMFVPVDELKPILSDLLTLGRSSLPPRPWLGIYSEEAHGHLFVTRVAQEGPGAKAGIEPGDIIVSIDGQSVETMGDFYRKLWAKGTAGVEVSIGVLRDSEVLEVKLVSASRYDWLRLN